MRTGPPEIIPGLTAWNNKGPQTMSDIAKQHYSLRGGLADSLLLARLCLEQKRTLVICSNSMAAERTIKELGFFLGGACLYRLPNWDCLPYQKLSPQLATSAERLRAYHWLLTPSYPGVLVTDVRALMIRPLNKNFLVHSARAISAEAAIERGSLVEYLKDGGFRRVSLVEATGDYSLRGEVIDFFPSTEAFPVRAEFRASTLHSLKLFHPTDQRSFKQIPQTLLLPVVETYSSATLSMPGVDSIHQAIANIKDRAKLTETPPREVAKILHALKNQERIPACEMLTNYAFCLSSPPSIKEYLEDSESIRIAVDQPAIQEELENAWQTIQEREQKSLSKQDLFPPKELAYHSPAEITELLAGEKINLSPFKHTEHPQDQNLKSVRLDTLRANIKAKRETGGAFEVLGNYIYSKRNSGFRIAFVVGKESRADRLQKILLSQDLKAEINLSITGLDWAKKQNSYPLIILQGSLVEGAELPAERLVFIAEREIFGESSVHKNQSAQNINIKKLLSSLSQLKEGDFVVHADYGIGLYRGFQHVVVEGIGSDLLQIEYADSTLYLPLVNISKIQRFTGADGQVPQLHKLGSKKWIQTKSKVRKSLELLAGDLIRLYASRELSRGWSFAETGIDDQSFSDTFAFDETEDQLKAIQDTLNDMTSEKPMDRLICGDVGFGKTEVAMRAAFKAAQHSKQTAILAPTTVLVEQHKQTFLNRFASFPIKVGAISRFYSAKDNKKTLEQLANGELDIIIGTHRLLQKDIVFNDLGLLVIDEEHRFGVKQKERIKQLKRNIDVLTLTATPIPRTLHMSLLELRDISVISTPPVNRRTIKTYIAGFEGGLIRDAILREIQRGGQCFYLFNRVQGIEHKAHELRELVPEARFEFAHGQMPERQLEKIMTQFLRHECDVLISTTIIESGLDIPNANTMLIERADTFGLAQLYQLRGRVGRSKRQAYCYFLIPETRRMSTDARQRLEALQALDDLGFGFQLALRDLEIRGAGNLLGKEQSGNVLSVGYDLYSKILQEAIADLSGRDIALEELIDPEIRIEINAYIPEDYILDISERLILYQRLSQIKSDINALELRDEIEDRFGAIPAELSELIDLMTFRGHLKSLGVERVDIGAKKISISFNSRAPISVHRIAKLVQSFPDKYRLSKSNSFTVMDPEIATLTPTQIYLRTEQLIRGVLEQ